MQRITLGATLVVAAIAAAPANAVILTAGAPQTSEGQLFSFQLAPATPNTGGGVFTISAQGDYTVAFPAAEFLDLAVEGLSFPGLAPANADEVIEFDFDDVFWSRSFALTATELATLVADGFVDVTVDLSDNVGLFSPLFARVDVALVYDEPVPAPAALALFGLGMAALGIRRRA